MLLGKPPLTDVTGLSPSLAPGSGGIVSTVRDVADFYRALLSGTLLDREQLRAMKTTVSERTGKDVAAGRRYGLGIGACGGLVRRLGPQRRAAGLRRQHGVQRGRAAPGRPDDQPGRDDARRSRRSRATSGCSRGRSAPAPRPAPRAPPSPRSETGGTMPAAATSLSPRTIRSSPGQNVGPAAEALPRCSRSWPGTGGAAEPVPARRSRPSRSSSTHSTG